MTWKAPLAAYSDFSVHEIQSHGMRKCLNSIYALPGLESTPEARHACPATYLPAPPARAVLPPSNRQHPGKEKPAPLVENGQAAGIGGKRLAVGR